MKKDTPVLKPSVDHIHQLVKRPVKDTQLQLRIDRFTKTRWSIASKKEGSKNLSEFVIGTMNKRVDELS